MEKRLCRYCKKEKAWIFSGYRPAGHKIKIYRDESGSLWNGARCPDCQNDILRIKAAKRRKIVAKK